MVRRFLLTAGATVALVAAPTVHAADVARSSAPAEAVSEVGGGSDSLVVIVLAVLVGVGLFFAVDGDDGPDSP